MKSTAAVIALTGTLASTTIAACEAPARVVAEGQMLSEVRPALSWSPVTGASAYRVRLQSQAPEGRIVATSDTITEIASYVPSQPLAERRAKVTVRVSARCGDEWSAETVSWFLIDVSAGCSVGELRASTEGASAALRWDPVPGAKSYAIRTFSLADGRLLASEETRTASANVPLREPAVVSVRAACASGLGGAAYRVLAR